MSEENQVEAGVVVEGQIETCVEKDGLLVATQNIVAFEDMPETEKLQLFVKTNEEIALAGGGQQDIADKLGLDVKRVSQLRQRLTNPKGAYGLTLTALPKGRKTNVAALADVIAQVRGVTAEEIMAQRKAKPVESPEA